MRIVFLDFDGVLNSSSAWTKGAGAEWIDPLTIPRLTKICKTGEASIVVSSTWRIGRPPSRLRELLYDAGLDRSIDILGVTPRFPGRPRGHEIQAWLDSREARHWGPIEKFVILDDDSDMAHLMPYLVKTSWETGLQDFHVEHAIAILRGESV